MLLLLTNALATCPPAEETHTPPTWAVGVPACEGRPTAPVPNEHGLNLWRVGDWLALVEPQLERHAWLGTAPAGAELKKQLGYLNIGESKSLELPTDRDFDGDGVADSLTRESDGGSGGRKGLICLTLASTPPQTACQEYSYSTYSRFTRVRVTKLNPSSDNGAQPLLGPNCPAVLDVSKPAFGSIVARQGPSDWYPGFPVDQLSACLKPEAPAESWNTLYTNAWEQSRTPQEVATSPRWTVYQHAHALAVYDPRKKQHRWMVSFDEKVSGGHKVDRWPIIQKVHLEGDTLRIQYGNALVEDKRFLTLDLE